MIPKKYCLLIASVSISVCLIGCMTPASLRGLKPVVDVTSKFDSRKVASCIVAKFQEIGGWTGYMVPVSMKVLSNGYAIDMTNNGSTAVLVDITETADGGSATKMWGAFGGLPEMVKSCQE
jgi:hypothetical protein